MARQKNNTNNFGDLSIREHSMTRVIQDNQNRIQANTTVSGLLSTITELFAEHKINTPASNRLLLNIRKSHSFEQALFTIYNSFLAGTGNARIA